MPHDGDSLPHGGSGAWWMVAVLFLPFDCAEDGKKDNPSSFGSWVRHLRPYAGRKDHEDEVDKFENARVVAPIKVSGVNTGPVLRWNFSPRWWGEWSALGAQTAYAGAANHAGSASDAQTQTVTIKAGEYLWFAEMEDNSGGVSGRGTST